MFSACLLEQGQEEKSSGVDHIEDLGMGSGSYVGSFMAPQPASLAGGSV